MSLIPVIELGFWNAWILILIFTFIVFMIFLSNHIWGNGELYQKMGEEPVESNEKRKNTYFTGVLMCLFLLSIFLPLKFGAIWIYLGLVMWLTGVAFFIFASTTVAITPTGQVFTKGIYRFSRHPLYLSLFMILLSVGLVSASWLYLLLSGAYFVFQNSMVVEEENKCVKNFGLEYLEYVKRTPRWLGIPKSKLKKPM